MSKNAVKGTDIMKNSWILLSLIIILSSIEPVLAKNFQATSCYGYLTELVRSSNFPFRGIKKNEISLIIDDDKGDMISAQVGYDQKRIKPDMNSFVLIGWIKYDIIHHVLWNNSADLNEHPVKLKFNRNHVIRFEKCRQLRNVNQK
ncbi:hypothetical protein [Commensalibacter oyaizuii]|uniref:Uncharacterized protein n=1 Tax=Commensalibacter oyaizuii TaxID=3043873 RepID=A0ABT6Q1D1_9PROT|nr:hypothetical protein [Commensalibacter sp. TBRC 16381]MDI2090922.1 hypothetical protein [Commensalibacter sp. TBRC 16381]